MIKRTTDVGGPELTLVSAASLGRGGFAIDLPLTGPSGVEDRSTLPNHRLTIAMTFNNAIASVGGASVRLWQRLGHQYQWQHSDGETRGRAARVQRQQHRRDRQ